MRRWILITNANLFAVCTLLAERPIAVAFGLVFAVVYLAMALATPRDV